MKFRRLCRAAGEIAAAFATQPRLSFRRLRNLVRPLRGNLYAQDWQTQSSPRDFPDDFQERSSNPLRAYFDAHTEGRGIWKWDHYFDIYHRHLKRFIGREVHVLEIGIYSGGSLEMWKEYFGPKCRIYGVDVQEACKAYEDEQTKIFIGSQGDRQFWKHFKRQVPTLDVLIDDGGHHTNQQIVTLEEMLPHLRPGGLYFCEDVVGPLNGFAAYVLGLADRLNEQSARDLSPFQEAIASVHLYPFVVAIERNIACPQRFMNRRTGTEWQPFYKKIPPPPGAAAPRRET